MISAMHITMEQLQLLLSKYESQEQVRLCKTALTTPGTITVFSTPKETSKITEIFVRRNKILGPGEKFTKGYGALLPELTTVTDPYIVMAMVLNQIDNFNLFLSIDYQRLIGILQSRSVGRAYEMCTTHKAAYA